MAAVDGTQEMIYVACSLWLKKKKQRVATNCSINSQCGAEMEILTADSIMYVNAINEIIPIIIISVKMWLPTVSDGRG